MQQLQLFAWQAAARGNDVHLNANPTQGELLHYEFRQKKEELKDTTKSSILAQYGGAEYLNSAPKELRQGQTEDYIEYSRSGQVIKGREKMKAKSKYPEDGMFHCFICSICKKINQLILYLVYINNHTAVWGSWYDTSTGNWGYACCHSSIHISYCSGLVGIEAAEASSAQQLLASSFTQPSQQKVDREENAERIERVDQNYSKKRIGEGDVKLDQELLAQSVLDEKKRKSGGMNGDDRSSKKQKSGLGGSHEVTEEELGMYLPFFSKTTPYISLQRLTG